MYLQKNIFSHFRLRLLHIKGGIVYGKESINVSRRFYRRL